MDTKRQISLIKMVIKQKVMEVGNCQISSTLYNAVLSLPNITVLERHDHSQEVYYVPIGKDAAVAHGSIDFKFRNDYDYPIKIYSSSSESTVDIRVVKL